VARDLPRAWLRVLGCRARHHETTRGQHQTQAGGKAVKPGDMNQIEDWDLENGWAWRSMLYFGIGLCAMLICSFITGVFFGYLIWGV
jgi:hypothetical protein